MPTTDPLTAINLRSTPQTKKADPRQTKNNAGGFSFRVSDETQVLRFISLGTTGGTYYVDEAALTKDNAQVVLAAARDKGTWLVEKIVEISTAGRAPRQNPGIFALAAVAGLGDDTARKAALAAIPAVCRTGTTLFQFATYVQQFRGWGRGLREAIAAWYLDKDVDQLAYQMVKYRQRNGFTHRDLLRLTHPKTTGARNALLHWAVTGDFVHSEDGPAPNLISQFVTVQKTADVSVWVDAIEHYPLPWEALPDAALAEPKVWRALIERGMPQTALMRQLPRLTRLGVLDGSTLSTVTTQLVDTERLRRARVHPVNVLIAQRTYAGGQSQMGKSSWEPNRKVVDALDAAFYAAYGAVQPAGKRTLVALDVSGSMGSAVIGPGQRAGGVWGGRLAVAGQLSCREAAAALSLVTLASEPEAEIVGFTSGDRGYGFRNNTVIRPLDITPRRRLDDVVRYTSNLPFGGTDCALPMVWADANNRDFDTVVIYTDNESWAGSTHPHQALRAYRDHTGIATKLIVVALAANQFSVADPSDPGMLDVVGLDSAVPNLVADFSAGRL